MAAVGSLNAAPGTVALFSNAGAWVNAYRQGAAVVSTMPTNFQGPGGPSIEVTAAAGKPRGTMDPDDFSSGFGVWSGTSFATPIMAADVAAALVDCADLDDVGQAAMVTRASAALASALGTDGT